MINVHKIEAFLDVFLDEGNALAVGIVLVDVLSKASEELLVKEACSEQENETSQALSKSSNFLKNCEEPFLLYLDKQVVFLGNTSLPLRIEIKVNDWINFGKSISQALCDAGVDLRFV